MCSDILSRGGGEYHVTNTENKNYLPGIQKSPLQAHS